MKRIITSLGALALVAGLSLGLTGGLAIPAQARPVPIVYTGLGNWAPHVRPGYISTGMSGPYAWNLHWSNWNSRSARATGTLVINNCVPYCAGHDQPLQAGRHPIGNQVPQWPEVLLGDGLACPGLRAPPALHTGNRPVGQNHVPALRPRLLVMTTIGTTWRYAELVCDHEGVGFEGDPMESYLSTDLSVFSESALFSSYQAILGELRSRGMIRTTNAPAGDYAEHLVVTALGGQLGEVVGRARRRR